MPYEKNSKNVYKKLLINLKVFHILFIHDEALE